MSKTSRSSDDTYNSEEAQQRFEAALRGARVAGHKPMSEMRQGEPKPSRGAPKGGKKRRSQAKKSPK